MPTNSANPAKRRKPPKKRKKRGGASAKLVNSVGRYIRSPALGPNGMCFTRCTISPVGGGETRGL